MKALYEKNLATVKGIVAAFEKKDMNTIKSWIADTAKWQSPAYGDTVNTKAHWMESLDGYLANWKDLHLVNARYLPGVDATSLELDGSVRYYGRWDGMHNSGKPTKVNFYATYNFNKDNKVIFGGEYFDLGGMMNAVKAK